MTYTSAHTPQSLTPQEPQASQRVAHRARSFLRGNIVQVTEGIRTGCTIRDISEVGARVTVSDSEAVPEYFDLEIPVRSFLKRSKIVWRHNGEMGVMFVSQVESSMSTFFTPNSVSTLEKRVAMLESKVEELMARLMSDNNKGMQD